MATDLYDESAETDEDERIEIVELPLTGWTTRSATAATRRRSSGCSGCAPFLSR